MPRDGRGGDEAQSRRMRKITANGKHGEDEEEVDGTGE